MPRVAPDREDAPGKVGPKPQTFESSDETITTEWRVEPRHAGIGIRTGREGGCHHVQVGEGAIHPSIQLSVRSIHGARVGFATPDLVQGLCARLVELEPARSSRSDQLTTRRNVQSGNLRGSRDSSKIAPLAGCRLPARIRSACAVRRDRVHDNSGQQPNLPLRRKVLAASFAGHTANLEDIRVVSSASNPEPCRDSLPAVVLDRHFLVAHTVPQKNASGYVERAQRRGSRFWQRRSGLVSATVSWSLSSRTVELRKNGQTPSMSSIRQDTNRVPS